MADITASRQTLLEATTTSDDDSEKTTTVKGGRQPSKNRIIKYVCPCCGTIIHATREVNVVCGDCGESFERA